MGEWDSKFGHTYGYFSGIKPMLVVRDLEQVKQVIVLLRFKINFTFYVFLMSLYIDSF